MANGILDPAFTGDGKTDLAIGGYTCPRAATFSGERLIVGGTASNGANSAFALAAYATGEPRQVAFTPASAMIAETAPAATLTVRLSQTAAQTVTVQYAATGGTASNGADYTLAPGTLTFAPGQTVQHIGVPLANDTADEVDETVVITLSSPSNAVLGSSASVTLTITDGDATLPTPTPTPTPVPTPAPPVSNKPVFLPLVQRP